MIVLPLQDILEIPLENVPLVFDNARSPTSSLSARKAREQRETLLKSQSMRRAVSLDEIGAYSRWTSAPSSLNMAHSATANAQGPFTKPSPSAAAIGKKLLERSARKLDKKQGTSFEESRPGGSPPPPTPVSPDSVILRKPRRIASPGGCNRKSLVPLSNGNAFRKTVSLNDWQGSSRLGAGHQNIRNQSSHSNFQWSVPSSSSSSSSGLKRTATLSRTRQQPLSLAGSRPNGLLNLRLPVRCVSPDNQHAQSEKIAET